MPYALSIAWRLMLSLALVLAPIAGARAAGGCCDAMRGMPPQAASMNHAADASEMPPCHMADMADMVDMAKMATPAKAPDSSTGHHSGCAAAACCLGAVAGLLSTPLVLPVIAPSTGLQVAHTHSPASIAVTRMLRPPIA